MGKETETPPETIATLIFAGFQDGERTPSAIMTLSETYPNVRAIQVECGSASAKMVKAVRDGWPNLERFTARSGFGGKSGAGPLSELPLTHLMLGDKGVTDAAIKPLIGALTSLRVLEVVQEYKGARSQGGVTDKTVVPLVAANPGLEVVTLSYTAVGDESVVAIGTSCPLLRELDVSRCPISDVGLAALAAGCPSLTSLKLLSKSVTDAGLAELTQLPLVRLHLSYASVTESGLCLLVQIPTLQVLDLQGAAAMTDTGIANAVRACPNLTHLGISPYSSTLSDTAKYLVKAVNAKPWEDRAQSIASALHDLITQLSPPRFPTRPPGL